MQSLPSQLLKQGTPAAIARLGRILDSLVGARSVEQGRLALKPVPASSSAPGVPGDVAADASYLYVCYAPNTWRRVAVSSF